jgi:hypothetical protein
VLIHTGLLLFAGLIVWTTLGRDSAGSANAAAYQPSTPAVGQMVPPQVPGLAPTAPDRRALIEEKSGSDSVLFMAASPATKTILEASERIDVSEVSLKSAESDLPYVEPTIVIPGSRDLIAFRKQRDAQDARYLRHGGIYGLPAAKRVVYLIDASGSLVDTLPFVLRDLRRSLTSLKPEQHYAVIFFRGDKVVEAPPMGIRRATTANLTQTIRWLNPTDYPVVPHGTARPDAAIRRALAYRPDTVILLSDGVTGRSTPDADQHRLMTLLEAADLGETRFHTVQLRDADPQAVGRRPGTLDLIARLTGGSHRFIPEAELADR